MSHAPDQHHFHAVRLSRLAAINAVQTLRSIADGLALIFVPIFLYELGHSLTGVLLYLVAFSMAWLISLYPSALFVARRGARAAIALSLPLSVGQFLLLITLPNQAWPVWTIALLGGTTTSLYWLGFRLLFSQALQRRGISEKVGAATALLILSAGSAPAIGGVIGSLFGLPVVYAIAVLLFIAAAVPLAFIPVTHTASFDLRSFDWKKCLPDFVSNAMINADDAAQHSIWPLVIFLMIPSYAGVGALSSVTLVTAIVVSLYAGFHAKRQAAKGYITGGKRITAAGNVLRLAASHGTQVFGVNFISGLGKSLALTPYMTGYYRRVEEQGLHYLVGMQAAGAGTWLVYFSLLWLFSLVLSTEHTLLTGLLLGAPAILGTGKLAKR